MTKTVNYRLFPDELLLVFFDREPVSVSNPSKNFEEIMTILNEGTKTPEGISLKDDNFDRLLALSSKEVEVTNFLRSGDLRLENKQIYYKNEPQTGYVVDTIFRMIDEGVEDVTPLMNFLDRLLKNPISGIREQLYQFLEYGKNALTPDGCFLAYKYVTKDLKSCHKGMYQSDGTFVADARYDHSVGSKPTMPREACDNDPNRTCSKGLHVCSRGYLSSSWTTGAHSIVVCKVDPQDVVAVPTDYNNTKMRTCGYEVVGVLSDEDVTNDRLARSSLISDYTHSFVMTTDELNSSWINSAEYSCTAGVLELEISGRIYTFFNVPEQVAKKFFDVTVDHSNLFNDYIEGRYNYIRNGD